MEQDSQQTSEHPGEITLEDGPHSSWRYPALGDPSSQLKDIFRKIEENSRTFREPLVKNVLEAQNVTLNSESRSLENSPLFQGSKSSQRVQEQLGEICGLLAHSHDMSRRLAGLIEALSEQARLQAAERVELDRERDRIHSWWNREQLSHNRRAAFWARFAFVVSLVGLVVGLGAAVLRPSPPLTPPVASNEAADLKPTLDRIDGRLNRIEQENARLARSKALRKKFRKKH